MAKLKTTTKKKQSSSSLKVVAYFVGFFACVLYIFSLLKLYEDTRPVVETPYSEMRHIPPDVRRRMLFASPSASLKVPILMYHYVENVQDTKDTIRQSLNTNPYIFEEQMATLKNAGYNFMFARELGDVLDGKRNLPKKPILITIDDGHWDVDTVILPILKKYNVKATAYVIPGFTGGSDFMSEDQIRDVLKSQLVEIGAHTVHHIALKDKSYKTVEYEVHQSKTLLQDTYHIRVLSFAYPNGSFDLQAADIAEKSGFKTAVSTIPGDKVMESNRYFLYRLRPGARTGQELLDWLEKEEHK